MKKVQLANASVDMAALRKQLQTPEFLSAGDCVGVDPRIMDGENNKHIAEAKQICSGCSVSQQCADWAILREESGIWGGLSPAERRDMRGSKKLIDLIHLDQLIDFHDDLFSGKTVRELAAEHLVTERTIYRWRAELSDIAHGAA